MDRTGQCVTMSHDQLQRTRPHGAGCDAGAIEVTPLDASADETMWRGRDGVYGEKGHDTLMGDGGSDRLLSGKGRDFLNGGRGTDVLRGAPGRDRARFDRAFDRIKGI